MINTITFSRIKVLLSAISIFIASAAFSQTGKAEPQKQNNSFGVSNGLWNTYFNKTNLLLEKVDEISFLNYVVVSSHENISEIPYFKKYIKSMWKKDKEELTYKVGAGLITSEQDIKVYLSSLQPAYSNYFADYLKHKDQIIESQNKLKTHGSGVPPPPFNCGSPCTNPGFESGTGFWDYSSGTADGTGTMTNIVNGFSSSAHVLETVGGYDPVVGGTTLPVVSPSGGNNSMMLGDGPVTGAHASRASISFTVSALNANFIYQFAVVLQDPVSGHADPERPYFDVSVKDAGGNLVTTCAEYSVMAKPPMPGFLNTPTPDVYYRPWTTVFVPLQAYIGQCITIQFTASDCSQGGHYGYAYIDANCTSLALPTSSAAVCNSANVTLTGPPGCDAYSWSNTAGGTTGIVGATNGQTVVVNQAGTYQVIVTPVAGWAGCTATRTITIPSSPNNPVPNFSNTTVCAGTPTQFTDLSTPIDSVTAWAWDFNNDGITDSTTQNPTHIFPNAGIYPVTLIISWGPCNVSIVQNVTVSPSGNPLISPVAPLCSNAAPFNLTVNTNGGSWSGTGITNTTTGTFDPGTASTSSTNVISYTTTGACGATDTIHISVFPSSTAAWTTTSLCSNSPSINLNTLVTGTSGGTWSGAGVTGNIFNPSGLSGSVPVTYTVGSAPCVSTSMHNITVTPIADATINPVSTLCSNAAPVTITAANTGGTWTGVGVSGNSFNPSGLSGSYVVTHTIPGACGAVDTIHVNVVTSSNPNWTMTSICSNATVINLNSLVTGTAGGTWSGTGVSGSTFNPAGLSGNTAVTYTVGQTPCVSTSTLPINVIPINASFNANPTSGPAPLSVNFTNTSSAGSYIWTFANGDNSTYTNDSTTYTSPGSYPVVLLVSHNGCFDTATTIIHVEQLSILTLPNVFTPNGDGHNDEWHAIKVEGLTSFKGIIYDRWGLKMYEWSDANAGWNGKAKNGSPAPDGTYYYFITAKGDDKKNYNYTGFIQLIRGK